MVSGFYSQTSDPKMVFIQKNFKKRKKEHRTIIFLLYLVLSNVEPRSILERILFYGLPLSTDKLCTFNKWLKSLTVFGTHKRIIMRCYFNSFLRKGWSISDYIATCIYILSQCWMLFPSNFWQCMYQTSQTIILIITGVFWYMCSMIYRRVQVQ